MRIHIFAVGKLKKGPETDLYVRYLDRFKKTGPALGFEFGRLVEIGESRAQSADGRKKEEANHLQKSLPSGASLMILDETGDNISSDAFSKLLADQRDNGIRDLMFAIGGADGHDPSTRKQAIKSLSFGKMTWPHQMARFMLAEQLYRSATILSGHPYHRL